MNTLAIVGSQSRAWNLGDQARIKAVIWGVIQIFDPEEVISGDSPGGGVDIWTREVCEEKGIPFRAYPPETKDWEGYKKRNIAMATACNTLVAIRSKSSTTFGSGWTANYAKKKHRLVKVIEF